MITLSQDIFSPIQASRTHWKDWRDAWVPVAFILSPRASQSLLICPWWPHRHAARSKSLRARQALTVSLHHPGSKPSTQQTSQNITWGQKTDASFPYKWESAIPISSLLLFLLMFDSGSVGSDAPLMVFVRPHLFPGHHTCSTIAALQAEKEPALLLPEITWLQTSPSWDWFLLSSPMVQSLLISSHSSLAPTRWPPHPHFQGEALDT